MTKRLTVPAVLVRLSYLVFIDHQPYAFIHSQFNYAPLIWLFAGKTAINKICKTHYRTLQ